MKKYFVLPFTILFAVAIFIFIITFSIGLPIYCRFFYYLQIEPLGIPKLTGYDYQTIKSSYDAVLDYLTLPSVPFSTGVFKYSESGASHFYDCKILFNLNAIALLISSAIIVIGLILDKTKKLTLLRAKGFHPAFYSAIGIFAFFIILIGLVSINFDTAFTVFHKIFFPGKDNWTFNPYVDEIINALPQQFFLNCAILIGTSIIVISLGIIVFCFFIRKNKQKTKKLLTESEK
ncbi:MAG: TIGR01906 family membrane protein [Clostridiales bacterium]|nr:TIGR01906 family membrane protein [Clostridiales bacterium]